jgi:hypothetical protein
MRVAGHGHHVLAEARRVRDRAESRFPRPLGRNRVVREAAKGWGLRMRRQLNREQNRQKHRYAPYG